MLQQNRTNTNIGVGVGIILQIAGRVIVLELPALTLVGLALSLVGLLFFIWGCMNYAEGKGYSKWLGLLGLLSCLGLIVLVILPDNNKSAG